MYGRGVSAILILLVVALTTTSCSDNKPAKITFTAPPPAVLDTKPFALQGAVLNKAGSALPGQKIAYSSNPVDVVSVTDSGECRCLRSGDASVLVAGGGLSSLVGVKCRLVSGIDVPREARFAIGEAVAGFHATALSESNSPLADVPVALNSSDEHVLRVADQALVPVEVGKATLRATAGGFTASTEVTVVQVVTSKPLQLNDGERQSWTLSAGNYEIEVKVAAAEGGGDGVTIAWLGSDCPNQFERQLHKIRGRVADTSSLTFENPTMLGMGSAINGYVKIVRVP